MLITSLDQWLTESLDSYPLPGLSLVGLRQIHGRMTAARFGPRLTGPPTSIEWP
jgi:hypothetical protein